MDTKVLMHICCGPCACYPVKDLDLNGFKITGYWYNPNIHGYSEQNKRLFTFVYFASKIKNFSIIEDNYEPEVWFKNQKNYSKKYRCHICYDIRLNKTAQKAKEKGFNSFTTTLLYSRFQDHDAVKNIGKKASKKYGINFFYKDFRSGWKEGVAESKNMGLYRQQYCGCIFSEVERYGIS